MKKVCMVIADHPFMDARIFKKEAKSLQKKGYSVTMIVPRRNGRLFDIDGTPFRHNFRSKIFTYEGIKIITYNSESSTSLNKVLSDVSVWESQGFNHPLVQLAMKEDADIYHTHEYLSLFAGIGIKRLMKKQKGKDVKLIYDSHELTPDPLSPRYPKEIKDNLEQKLFIMLDEVDYVITVSESIKSWYKSHKPNLPVEVIYNSPPLAKNYLSKDPKPQKMIVGFEGNIDNKQRMKEKIIEITDICSKMIDFQFKVIGGSRYNDVLIVPDSLKSKIIMTGWVDYRTIPSHMKEIDVGWVDLEDVEQSLSHDYAMPNKFFSYLNNGIPVVVNKCHDMEQFIRRHQCGVVIDKTKATAKDYANVLLSLHQDRKKLRLLGDNGRKAMENLYSWERMEQRLFEVYQQLI
ncbi:glycosyltransferase family 4 protein [Oceanobacillus massiliensis]|uniref:glycosyltransferase family 4 protein n=1 Tax=Oceanobacillus massiliensis TaxID=1465765 RepID=UPI000289A309|nr:glycosyltransferase family 4 protein [Oceanobacillus massiliensis]